MTFDKLAASLSNILDRHVVDQTGVGGRFRIHVEFAHDENAPGNLPPGIAPSFDPSEVARGTSVFTAVEEQLGLKLTPGKSSRGYIVIDRVERPSPN